MAACAVCGTGLRAEATHCTTCGTPTGVTAPAASVPSPFETGAGWRTIATTTGGPPAGVTERVTLELVTDPAGSVITTE